MPHLAILEFELDVVAGWDFWLLPVRKMNVFCDGKKIKIYIYLNPKGGPSQRLVGVYQKNVPFLGAQMAVPILPCS